MLSLQSFCRCRKTYKETKKLEHPFTLGFALLDSMVVIQCMSYLTQKSIAKSTSTDDTRLTTGILSSIPWGSSDITPEAKFLTFQNGVDDLMGIMKSEELLDFSGALALIVLLIRIIVATRSHPRLAVLTGTVAHASDDLCVVLLVFALRPVLRLFGDNACAFCNRISLTFASCCPSLYFPHPCRRIDD